MKSFNVKSEKYQCENFQCDESIKFPNAKISDVMNVSRLKNPKKGLEKTEMWKARWETNVGGQLCSNLIVETKIIGFHCFTVYDSICVAF